MHPRTRSLVVALAALALFVPTQAVGKPGGPPQPRPQLLKRAAHGSAVVEALGDRLPAAAQTNRMSSTRLREILETDPTAWLGKDGQLFYVEEAEAPATAAAITAAAAEPVAAAAYPTSQTFSLHSLPGSTHTIYLDFDGANVSGTWWNSSQGMPAQFYTGFTLDSDPSTFTAAEHAYIQQVWRIVSEKFAPFDVDVTTEDPGADAYNRSSSLDPTYGDHVVITDNTTAVNAACGGGCSGVALLGTFNDTWYSTAYLEPAWVFSSMTSDSAALTAHTVAHEVGHTFDLQHDGDTGGAYADGHANWFPIMGSSARAVGQFSKGEYAGATNTEDDVTMIAANGAPLRADDHSDLTLGATAVAPGTVANGFIGTRNDKDVFAVTRDCATDLTAAATGIGVGTALDLSVTVLAADGTVLGSANPTSGQNIAVWPAVPTGMDATVKVAAGAGTYYVRVDGVGKGDPVSNGYSDYDSMGYYQVAISACDGTVPTTTLNIGATGGSTSGTTIRTPSAPRIGKAKSGRRGKPIDAVARWKAPASTGGAPVLGYRVLAQRLSKSGRVVKQFRSIQLSSGARKLRMRLPKGKYRFRVVAYNRAGSSAWSTTSRIVRAR